jgi:UDP-N-acetylglucosamine--N-acetylmuramyl-(pentapeptide) pyrophosphoryl-undecaprenol N-acetylglucosamine transferase
MRPVLYYVHHQGLGHWRRALAVTANLSRPVIFASSTPPPQPLPATARFRLLPADFPVLAEAGVSAHGRLHWAPTGHSGLLERHHLLLTEAARHRPAVAVVDVSVEVTVFLRSSGIPVIAVRLPGRRDDAPHDLGFGLADDVVMPVPSAWHLHDGLARTTAVGLVGAAGPADSGRAPEPRRVLVVVGSGGSRLDRDQCVRIAADLPDHQVRVLGLSGRNTPVNLTFAGRVTDPRAEFAAASVVIGNAGLGTVSDVVTAGRPFVAVPEDRSFDEQRTTGRALTAHRDAVVLTDLPSAGGWRDAVEQATARGPAALIADGAVRFARLIEARAAAGDVAVEPLVRRAIPAPSRAVVAP